MVHSVEELLNVNLHKVFGERDDESRKATIAEFYDERVAFQDPEGTVVGREAVNAKARNLLDGAPGFVFASRGEPETTGQGGSLAWSFGPAGQTPVVYGRDTIAVQDGVIASVRTVLETLSPETDAL